MAHGAPQFNPADFTGTVNCGVVHGDGGDFGLFLSVSGDGAGYFTLAVTIGGRSRVMLINMGAAEWSAFVAAVRKGESSLAALIREGKCDELSPVC